ncbi:UNVERIFIED_CONTAM: hypothetical protein FKN15_046648 [Acipenser sinensis]
MRVLSSECREPAIPHKTHTLRHSTAFQVPGGPEVCFPNIKPYLIHTNSLFQKHMS